MVFIKPILYNTILSYYKINTPLCYFQLYSEDSGSLSSSGNCCIVPELPPLPIFYSLSSVIFKFNSKIKIPN